MIHMNSQIPATSSKTEEKYLRFALGFVIFLYVLNFLFLGFLIGPFDYDHLSAYYLVTATTTI
jgi:hypothetical protein